MRQAATFILSLTVLLLTLGSGLAKDPDPADKAEPDKKKRSYDRILGRTLDEWIKFLKHPDPSLRRDAIQAVQQYGEDSTDAVPALVNILSNDQDAALRSCAAVVLMNVEVRDSQIPSVVEALCVQLEKNFQLNVRYHCAVALGGFENEAQRAIPALINATKDMKSWEVRQAACYSLFRMYQYQKDYPQEKRSFPDARTYLTLVAALSDPASKVRMEALQALLNFGPPNDRMLRDAVVSGLLKLMNDREKSITVWAYVGLMFNHGINDIYLNALTKMLKEGDVPTKMQVVNAFGVMIREIRSPVMKKKLLDIVAILKEPASDPQLLTTACWTLVNINNKLEISDDAIKAIKAISEDTTREQWVRFNAKNAHAELTKKPETVKTEAVVKPERR